MQDYRRRMCGNHNHDGTPIDHHHTGPVFLPEVRGPRRWRRRAFLGEFGKGTMAFAVLAPTFVAACSDDTNGTASTSTTDPTAPATTAPTTSEAPTAPESTAPTTNDDETLTEPLTWARVNLGFVSAYVLARGTEVAIVDTGVDGSADDIGETLVDIGLDYSNVNHVILTHLHGDHAGSIGAVMDLAGSATAYAGTADIGGIAFDQVTATAGGDDVFGLEVIATPGHTDGHISVIDHDAGVLVAGDAINVINGGVQGPAPEFSTDIDVANDSARRLAELSFNTLLVGHGDPIEDMADTAVAAMAAAL